MKNEKIIIKQSAPIYGTLSIIFGFIEIFILSPLFSPLAFILGLLACLQKEYAAGILGIVFSIVGILTSPILMALLHMPNIVIHHYKGISI
tara:strand:+ start:400 stop:672 length:273 start_codon:yes stop_codon:yes gene_type:complete